MRKIVCVRPDRILIIRRPEERHEYGRDRTGARCETAHFASRRRNLSRRTGTDTVEFLREVALCDRTDQEAKLHRDKRTDYDIAGDEDRP